MKTGILLASLGLLSMPFAAEAAPSCKSPHRSVVYQCAGAKAPVRHAPTGHRIARANLHATSHRHDHKAARESHRLFVRRDTSLAYAQSGYDYHSGSRAYGGGGAPVYQPVRTYQSGAYYGYNAGDGGPAPGRYAPWKDYNRGYGNGY